MIARHVQTTYCDDIRYEIGGKLSYIGVYTGKLFVPQFPTILPKLCFSVKVVTPADKPLHSIVVRVLKDDEIIREVAVDDNQLKSASEDVEEELKERAQVAHVVISSAPMQFDAPCTLKVHVLTEDNDELKGLGLAVAQAIDSEYRSQN